MIKRWLKGDKKSFPRQLEFELGREYERDRNAHKGGRSFYFFDFDDNIATVGTPTYVFHKDSNEQLQITSRQFIDNYKLFGKSGPFKDYVIDFCDVKGTFRRYRDHDISAIKKVFGRKQPLLEDILLALGSPDLDWKGPSWDYFHYAVANQRPVSIITARGHRPETVVDGIDLFVRHGYLPARPNYHTVFPVNDNETKTALGDAEGTLSVAELKRKAIRASVQKAFSEHGQNDFHRFGMSDDDPANLELIYEELKELKLEFPKNAFFVIDTARGQIKKTEVTKPKSVQSKAAAEPSKRNQASLFQVESTSPTPMG